LELKECIVWIYFTTKINHCFDKIKGHVSRIFKANYFHNIDFILSTCKCLEDIQNYDFSRYISIPYIKDLSKVIKSKLKRINFETVFAIQQKLNCVIKKGKDVFKQTELVYKINCQNCEVCYIRQIKKHLKTRKEHMLL